MDCETRIYCLARREPLLEDGSDALDGGLDAFFGGGATHANVMRTEMMLLAYIEAIINSLSHQRLHSLGAFRNIPIFFSISGDFT